jgi:hypothetical protein
MSLPAKITITQGGISPAVAIAEGALPAPPAGLPPYPLTDDPSETWYLTLSGGVLAWVQVNTAEPLTVTAPASGTAGVPLAVTGTVVPPGNTVYFALGPSSTISPGAWIPANNTGGALSSELTPLYAGTWYAWASDFTAGGKVVSGPIEVTASSAALSFDTPGTASYSLGSAGTIALGGGVAPAQPLALQVALSHSNSAPPVTGWVAAINSPDEARWSADLPIPVTVGSYYAWVQSSDGDFTTVSVFTIEISA